VLGVTSGQEWGMSTWLSKIIAWVFILAAILLLLFASMVRLGMGSDDAALRWVPYGGFLIAWCLNGLLFHWKEHKPFHRFVLVMGVLAGPLGLLALLSGVQKPPDHRLYFVILAVCLLLAGVIEVARNMLFPRSPDNKPDTYL
jgi:peptidoglycan/LPS O-acetylase OafA/YrhL